MSSIPLNSDSYEKLEKINVLLKKTEISLKVFKSKEINKKFLLNSILKTFSIYTLCNEELELLFKESISPIIFHIFKQLISCFSSYLHISIDFCIESILHQPINTESSFKKIVDDFDENKMVDKNGALKLKIIAQKEEIDTLKKDYKELKENLRLKQRKNEEMIEKCKELEEEKNELEIGLIEQVRLLKHIQNGGNLNEISSKHANKFAISFDNTEKKLEIDDYIKRVSVSTHEKEKKEVIFAPFLKELKEKAMRIERSITEEVRKHDDNKEEYKELDEILKNPLERLKNKEYSGARKKLKLLYGGIVSQGKHLDVIEDELKKNIEGSIYTNINYMTESDNMWSSTISIKNLRENKKKRTTNYRKSQIIQEKIDKETQTLSDKTNELLINSIMEKNAKIEAEIERLLVEAKQKTREFAEVHKRSLEKNIEIEELQTKLHNLHKDFQVKCSELNSVTEKLERKRSKIKELRQLEDDKNVQSMIILQKNHEISRLSMEIADTKQINENLLNNVEELSTNLKDYKEELSSVIFTPISNNTRQSFAFGTDEMTKSLILKKGKGRLKSLLTQEYGGKDKNNEENQWVFKKNLDFHGNSKKNEKIDKNEQIVEKIAKNEEKVEITKKIIQNEEDIGKITKNEEKIADKHEISDPITRTSKKLTKIDVKLDKIDTLVKVPSKNTKSLERTSLKTFEKSAFSLKKSKKHLTYTSLSNLLCVTLHITPKASIENIMKTTKNKDFNLPTLKTQENPIKNRINDYKHKINEIINTQTDLLANSKKKPVSFELESPVYDGKDRAIPFTTKNEGDIIGKKKLKSDISRKMRNYNERNETSRKIESFFTENDENNNELSKSPKIFKNNEKTKSFQVKTEEFANLIEGKHNNNVNLQKKLIKKENLIKIENLFKTGKLKKKSENLKINLQNFQKRENLQKSENYQKKGKKQENEESLQKIEIFSEKSPKSEIHHSKSKKIHDLSQNQHFIPKLENFLPNSLNTDKIQDKKINVDRILTYFQEDDNVNSSSTRDILEKRHFRNYSDRLLQINFSKIKEFQNSFNNPHNQDYKEISENNKNPVKKGYFFENFIENMKYDQLLKKIEKNQEILDFLRIDGKSIKIENLEDFKEFLQIYEKEHWKCGGFCDHLKRFYDKLGWERGFKKKSVMSLHRRNIK